MDSSEFFKKYSDEASCKAYFKELKERKGLKCKRCEGTAMNWIESESRWRCRSCNQSMSIKTDTVMENSNLGYKKWMWCMYYMTLTKKGFSAMEMQRLLGHKRYAPIWLMMQKLRIVMGRRDAKYKLEELVEMDEAFLSGHRKKEDTNSKGKPTKELDRKVRTIVAVSKSETGKKNKHKPSSKPRFMKMSVVTELSKKEITYEAGKMLKTAATVITDGKTAYRGLADLGMKHWATVIKDKTQVSSILPWVHIAISNAKKKILGLHHQVNDKYLQNYMDEFCYKFNRRNYGTNLFERLIECSTEAAWFKSFPN